MEIKNLFNLKGKTALVTGGSQGIGKAISLALAEYGADLVINYRSNNELAEQTKKEIIGKGAKCWLTECDLSLPDSAKRISRFLLENNLSPDILVLNASVQYRKAWDKVTPDEFEAQININFRASLFLIQELFPHMKKKQMGTDCNPRQCSAGPSSSANDCVCGFKNGAIEYGEKPGSPDWKIRSNH
jgi:glucose 1-dehydrogenase